MTTPSYLDFRSRVDGWIWFLILGACALSIFTSVVMVLDDETGHFTTALFILLTAASSILLLWVLFGTRYRLTDTQLKIQSGPFHRTVHLDSIMTIRPVRNWQSGSALSKHRLLIRYDRFSTVEVAPENRGRFLDEVAERAPQLVWEDEKLVALS
ncbi:MAG: PH domain-containing protein [bacterium]|nr:PH domain-containing protein [bacterium]